MQSGLEATLRARSAHTPVLDVLETLVRAAPGNLKELLANLPGARREGLLAAQARAGFSRGHLLDIVLYSPLFVDLDEERGNTLAEKLVARLLGERILDSWVGQVTAVATPARSSLRVLNSAESGHETFPIAELAQTVRAAIRGLYTGLPEPCWNDPSAEKWTLFELTPEPASDYAAQDDLVLATTTRPEMLKCFLRGERFCSERFSRHDELFCYVKYKSRVRSHDKRLAERSRLEDAFSGELARQKLGAVVGNGFGVRYSYIDLALGQAASALECVRQIANRKKLASDSWVLFCDTELENQWLPLGRMKREPYGLARSEQSVQ
ncbi:MAG TPA: hypothetical protein VK524_32685 [Polyangiaceae bacterium]|nr:hypothetical protein [Polyangiaceae bacterium]